MPHSFVVSGVKLAWEQLSKSHSCVWEEVSIVSQLGFLGILSIYAGLSTCKDHCRPLVGIGRGRLDKTILILVCSALLLGVHLTLLSVKLVDQSEGCSELTPLLLATQASQAISWGLTMISACRIQLSVPGILRLWWACNSLLHAINVAQALVTDSEKRLTIQDYASLAGLISSTCLVLVSIRPVHVHSSEASLAEPLLGDDVGKAREYSLYGKATPSQLVTFSWLNPLFVAGNKKPLEQEQIPDVDVRDSAAVLSQSFQESLGSKQASIYKVVFLFAWKRAAVNALLAVISAAASYVGPYLVTGFVNFLQQKKDKGNSTGYLIALAFLAAKVVETTAQRQWIFGARLLGLRLRAAVTSHIYQKGLLLSSQSKHKHTSGEIINYMSVDVQRISDLCWYLNTVAMLPIQISLAVYILHTNLGMASIAALAATLMVMSCNVPLTRAQKRYQSRIMESKDARMKATSETLRSIKTIKLQAWDNQFLEKLEGLRSLEYDWIWKSLRLGAIGAFIFWGSPTFISVATFAACFATGIPLTAGRVLSALATFRMLQDPIFNLPDLLNVVAQAKVSVDRLASYLQQEEIQKDAIERVPKHATPYAIDIQRGRFSWDPDSTTATATPTLDGIQLKVERGMKVAICGSVGSGKSSLLSGIIGEIHKVSGEVKISGSKAYVPQSPWILTGNIRDNILFGSDYDADKYARTVKACALEKDFELFSCGDLTEIGERGINMSGGQKQRIQIARAVYQDADTYLLDDPFSAVDAHTGTQLFQECLMGILKHKTILYVTHQVEFLPAADLILVMEKGKITQAGSFDSLLAQSIGFEVLVGAHNEALESILAIENSSRASQDMESEQAHETNGGKDDNQTKEITTEKEGKLIQEEERETGSIDKQVYWSYLTIVKHGVLVPLIILAQSSFQVLQIASNYWMAWACPVAETSVQPLAGMDRVLVVYTLLSVVSSLCVLARATLVATQGLLAAQSLFINLLHCVIRAPMSFFDSTPTGRILNRASSDQSVLDLEMANRLGWAAFSIIQLLGTVAVMSQVAWEVFIIFIPVTAICIWYKQYYIPTARELARIAEIQKAPIFHHFAESLTGAATIRAFDQKERFISANLTLIDNFSKPWFHNVSAMEWLSFRLNQLSNLVFAFSLVLLVSLPDGIINPSIAGLAVTYGINLNVLQASVIWNICNAENKMISVERILQYSKLKSEAPLVIQDSTLPNHWPTSGTICFQNLQIRYADHLPAVLKNITCTFPGRKKIGVVGRTGSGKSTLIQAIFRIVEPSNGSIIIDDMDICKIGLHDLRSRLSIIPQDPTMFDGTVRGNLDPLNQYSDIQIWEALDKCQLGDLVRAKEGKLDSKVVENGENWSAGQRQLFCLGRVLLKRSNILVLDEATASVDSATDAIIQKIIDREFEGRTIVTIAHRIHTVIDSDLVLVLSEGRIGEYDTPSRLLEREDSFFSRLIRDYSNRSQSCNNFSNSKN